MMKHALVISLVCALFAAPAGADTVFLKNGNQLEGEVIKDDGKVVVVRVTDGEVTFKASDVEAIDRRSPLETSLSLARQQLNQGNLERAARMFEDAYLANKSSADARRMLATAYDIQGRKYRDLHRFAEARTAWENLLKIDPKAESIAHDAAKSLKDLEALAGDGDAKVAQARDLAAAGNWPAAIAAFEKALAFTPDVRATILPEVAQCHVRRAIAHAQDGNALNAAADLDAALSADPCLAGKLESFYVSCAIPGILNSLARGDIASAEVDLKRARELAPANPKVLYVAGRIQEALGRIPAAAAAYAKGLDTRVANATPQHTAELRKKLEAELGIRGDAWKIDTTFAELTGYAESSSGPAQKLETENFLILHYKEPLAREAGKNAEAARARILESLGLKPWKGKARIYLHRTQAEYTARTGQAEWTGGYSRLINDGTRPGEAEIHSWQTSPRLLASVLPHEIAHLVINSNLPEFTALPKCLHEGFAVLMEPGFRHAYFRDFLRIRCKSQDFIPLADLLAKNDYPRDPEFFYAEGFGVLDFLIRQRAADGKERGAEAAVGLIKSAAKGARARDELLRITGFRSLEEFEAAWKQWILKEEK